MTITNKTILIIGVTRMLGKPVAQQLKADGFNVRLLARNPEKAQKLLGAGYEIVKGDVDNAAALKEAMTGVDGVHISLKGGPTEADFELANDGTMIRNKNTVYMEEVELSTGKYRPKLEPNTVQIHLEANEVGVESKKAVSDV